MSSSVSGREENHKRKLLRKRAFLRCGANIYFSLFEILKPEKQQLKEEGRKELLNAASCQGALRAVPAVWEALLAQEEAIELLGL